MKTTVRSIDLTRSEVDHLKSTAAFPPTLVQCFESIQWRSNFSGTLKISAVIAEEFREAFSEHLARVGFDDTYAPTAEGKLLEDLIDRFYKGDS